MSSNDLGDPYEASLSTQLALSRETWRRLQELGGSKSTELRLDFFFLAESEQEARALHDVLTQETDYDVTLEALDDGGLGVAGTAQPVQVTLETLDQWVGWMITAGLRHRCQFDGWGTEIP